MSSERFFIGRRYFRDFCTTFDTGNANVKQLILHFNPSTQCLFIYVCLAEIRNGEAKLY